MTAREGGRLGLAMTTLMMTLATGCNRKALSVLVDLPPDENQQTATGPAPVLPATLDSLLKLGVLDVPDDGPRPEIESFLDPDSAVARLPRDPAGNIDWMAALREGIIDPRPAPPDEEGRPARNRTDFKFAFDFYLPGPDSTLDAYFPHSAHTEWLNCQQCHSRIFRYRGTPITMADIFRGRYCAECHGKVSFPVMTDCERCHTGLSMPPNRATPELIGTVTLTPAAEIASRSRPDTAAQGGNFSRMGLPPAKFPHWLHRIRFRCKACHMEIFEPRAGANAITMGDISAGRFCGRCHNGRDAFAAGFGACERCHASEPAN